MTTIKNRIRFIRALYNRPFALLWVGQAISSLGSILTDHIGPRLVFIACGIIALLLEFTALTVRGMRQLD